ncbi:MAG: hypothetical protein Tsb0015_08250 [Simkaniaceae bacterium]
MKKMFFIFLSFCAALAFFGCNNQMLAKTAKMQNNNSKKDKKEQLLFVIHAKKGHLKINESNPDTGTITLMDTDNHVVFFTDRPDRKAGKISMEEFLNKWSQNGNSFAENPPNAGFIFFEDKENTYSEVNIELTNPQYQKAEKELAFDIRFLEEEHSKESMELVEPVLFIDAALEIARAERVAAK